MAGIVEEIRGLMRSDVINPEHDATAADVSDAICQLVSEISLLNPEQDQLLDSWGEDIGKARCLRLGYHSWVPDHCGYWGHQYCSGCGVAKYPELPGSCSAARSKIGDISEAEYIAQNAESSHN